MMLDRAKNWLLDAGAGGTRDSENSDGLVESNENPLPRLAGAHKPVKPTDTDANGKPYGEAAEYANRIHDKAEATEPQITDAMLAAMDSGGLTPQGLAFRLKEQDSMARKIRDTAAEKGGLDMSAASIFDANRYTGTSIGLEDYTAGAQAALDSLREQGYQVVQVKSTWGHPENPYRGVNVKVLSQDGNQIELQFHTPDSKAAALEMHGMYDEQRLLPPDSPQWKELNDKMWAISESLGSPPGIENLH
jgi:hypothetical protein